MRRTSLSLILALSLVVGACDSDSGPSVAKLEDMRVVKVSGDQASQVPAAPSTTIYATAGASLQVGPGDGYTAEPLVARVEAVGAQGRGIMSGGPVVPAGTMIHWDIPEVAGKLRGLTTATDDSAHIVNRWAPGTKAGTYVASAHRILAGGTITDDAEWELVVLPGAAVEVVWGGPGYPTTVNIGDTLDVSLAIKGGRDQHGNLVDVGNVVANIEARTAWSRVAVAGQVCSTGASTTAERQGWLAVVPADVAEWPVSSSGHAACLHISLNGRVVSRKEIRLK